MEIINTAKIGESGYAFGILHSRVYIYIMKTTNLFAIATTLIFSTFATSAQNTFTPARWTKSDGTQLDILIDFKQWDASPTSIRYKTAEGQDLQELLPGQVRELRVFSNPEEIYTGRETSVAVFSKDASISAEISYQRKAIFLRALMLGSLNLYVYQDENDVRHFFIEKDTLWEELIYHHYYIDREQRQSRPHHRYKTQLLRATPDCPGLAEKIKKSSFGEKTLTGIVASYNSPPCNGQLLFREQKTKSKNQIGIRAGGSATFNKTSFVFGTKYSGKNTHFQPNYGLSALFFLPRLRGSKALIIDLLYDSQEYRTDEVKPTSVKETYWQIHISARQYWSLGILKPFMNAGFLIGFPGNREFSKGWVHDYSPPGQTGISLGGGVRWKKLEGEVRIITNQLLSLRYSGVDSSISLSLTLCYLLN